MIKSMTGFASMTRDSARATITVTARAVNHRFLDLQLRLPPSCAALEPAVRALAQARLGRGRVELGVAVQPRETRAMTVKVDLELARALAAAMDRARADGLVSGPLSPGDLLRLPQAVSVREQVTTEDPEADAALAAEVLSATEQALADLDGMRALEGAHLAEDLDARRRALAGLVDAVRAAAEAGRAALEARVLARVAELGLDATVDQAAIAQEIVRMAARSDISEELTRLSAHVEHWRALAEGAEPCGRKLDFLVQEMNREFNTIGAKADGTAVPELVITAKVELERVREQVQNVE